MTTASIPGPGKTPEPARYKPGTGDLSGGRGESQVGPQIEVALSKAVLLKSSVGIQEGNLVVRQKPDSRVVYRNLAPEN